MSNDLNSCSFIGRLGKDPEVRFTPSGEAVANLSLAVGWKGQKSEGTEWVRLVAFGKLAEVCGEYLKKGGQIYAQGRMRTRKWQDKEGRDQYTTEVVMDRMQMLARAEGQAKPEAKPAKAAAAADDFDDDISF
jgi:single-strand DNA-binding protein